MGDQDRFGEKPIGRVVMLENTQLNYRVPLQRTKQHDNQLLLLISKSIPLLSERIRNTLHWYSIGTGMSIKDFDAIIIDRSC